eukprot:scaffold5931_cov173-Ochromonas_danica.AAC.6
MRRRGGVGRPNADDAALTEVVPLVNVEVPPAEQLDERNADDINRRMNEETVRNNVAFNKARNKAQEIVQDRERVNDVLRIANARRDRLLGIGRAFPMTDFMDMIEMIRCVDRFPLRVDTKVLIITSLIYFISPVDLIPDIIPLVGLLDDIGVIGLTIRQIKVELVSFRAWRANGGMRAYPQPVFFLPRLLPQQEKRESSICPCTIA